MQVGAGTTVNHTPLSEGLAEKTSWTVVGRRAAKREVSLQSTVAGVDLVGDGMMTLATRSWWTKT